MFNGCNTISTLPIENWPFNKVINLKNFLSYTEKLQSLDVTSWDVSNVQDMAEMFRGSGITSIEFTNGTDSWNVSNVTDTQGMFSDCQGLMFLDLSTWNSGTSTTQYITDMSYMFNECKNLTEINFGEDWNTSSVTTVERMFSGCTDLYGLDVSKFNTHNVINMSGTFNECKILEELNVDGWDTSNVENMSYMFAECSSIVALNLTPNGNIWDVSKVKDMSHMFAGMTKLESSEETIDVDDWIGSWHVSYVENFSYMFDRCIMINKLPIAYWNVGSARDLSGMFNEMESLEVLDIGHEDHCRAAHARGW